MLNQLNKWLSTTFYILCSVRRRQFNFNKLIYKIVVFDLCIELPLPIQNLLIFIKICTLVSRNLFIIIWTDYKLSIILKCHYSITIYSILFKFSIILLYQQLLRLINWIFQNSWIIQKSWIIQVRWII
jgi:hypothetical protein